MARIKKNPQPSEETKNEAMQIARATQRPGQTKEQTKLIAIGIQKGIDQYKKQHKAKQREMDKRRKQDLKSKQASDNAPAQLVTPEVAQRPNNRLAWILLILSWIVFGLYLSLFPH